AVRAGQRRPRDFAVFYRVNALSRAFEFAFREQGIPYQMVNALEFYQRKEIKDVVAYLQLVNNPRNSVAFLRVINVPARGIGKTTLERLTAAAHDRGLPLLEVARNAEFLASLGKRPRSALEQFVRFFDHLGRYAAAPVEELLGHILAESGYREQYSDSELEEDQQRLANIEELLTAAREFDERHPEPGALEAFLEDVCLANDTDAWEADDDRVTMMTLHAAKGLEFPVVFIAAVEQGLLPHERSANDPDQLEEERRLLFVGLTRAREELILSRAEYREFRGLRRMSVPSSFLMELPREAMDVRGGISAVPWGPADDIPPWENDPADSDSAYISQETDAASDDSFDPATFASAAPESPLRPPAGAAPASHPGRSGGPRLTTGAELAGQSAAHRLPAVPPDTFCLDMVVCHPEYGLGRIVALSGEGQRRSATVRFASAAGERKFVLAKSPLRPAKDAP
ncbi:MAG: ATP-binding domain-containing protein, partial [Planctomycetaceae bacterium]|nr:ATP-binding domain-containing protein [Planctomycetaceae bacterium]